MTILMTGQQAYETDVKGHPNYHDGLPRRTWQQIGKAAQASWNQNPTPREYSTTGGTPTDRIDQ
jgi:hypothetical protein